MAPIYSRQILIWTLPTFAAIVTYIYYRRKKIVQSDSGDINNQSTPKSEAIDCNGITSLETTPKRQLYSRSLSGVDSTPIDIVIPPELRLTKSIPLVVPDEYLDEHIEKIKSMKYTHSMEIKKLEEEQAKKPKQLVSPKKETFTVTTPKKQVSSSVKTSPKTAINIVKDDESPPKNNNKGEVPDGVAESPEASISPENDTVIPTTAAGTNENSEKSRKISERDSANPSPAEVMLNSSPSLSSLSNRSEGSEDSGTGSGQPGCPSPSPPQDNMNSYTINVSESDGAMAMALPPQASNITTNHRRYEFVLPRGLVGILIGRKGSFVNKVKNEVGANIIVKKHPSDATLRLCRVEGTDTQIFRALEMIRNRFPIEDFPDVDLNEVSAELPLAPVYLMKNEYVNLVEGINNFTIVSCIVAPNHLFMQTPGHYTFPNLRQLTECMTQKYSTEETPALPRPIREGSVCAAFSVDSWFRAHIVATDEESDTSYVKFLDYGGFAYIVNSELRMIDSAYCSLTFQAAECFLAYIKPVNDIWKPEAYDVVSSLTAGEVLCTQVAGISSEGVPLVLIYILKDTVIFLNYYLVQLGYAELVCSNAEIKAAMPLQMLHASAFVEETAAPAMLETTSTQDLALSQSNVIDEIQVLEEAMTSEINSGNRTIGLTPLPGAVSAEDESATQIVSIDVILQTQPITSIEVSTTHNIPPTENDAETTQT